MAGRCCEPMRRVTYIAARPQSIKLYSDPIFSPHYYADEPESLGDPFSRVVCDCGSNDCETAAEFARTDELRPLVPPFGIDLVEGCLFPIVDAFGVFIVVSRSSTSCCHTRRDFILGTPIAVGIALDVDLGLCTKVSPAANAVHTS